MWNTDKPESGKKVLLLQEYNGKRRICVGKYIEAYTEDCCVPDHDWYDYCEKTDTYYTPEGFYEQTLNWGEYNSIFISEKVLGWLELPPTEEL